MAAAYVGQYLPVSKIKGKGCKGFTFECKLAGCGTDETTIFGGCLESSKENR